MCFFHWSTVLVVHLRAIDISYGNRFYMQLSQKSGYFLLVVRAQYLSVTNRRVLIESLVVYRVMFRISFNTLLSSHVVGRNINVP